MMIEEILAGVRSSINSFPRGEGGPEGVGRGTAKPDSQENACYMEITLTFPPEFLFSHEIALGDFMTASPREKRLGAAAPVEQCKEKREHETSNHKSPGYHRQSWSRL